MRRSIRTWGEASTRLNRSAIEFRAGHDRVWPADKKSRKSIKDRTRAPIDWMIGYQMMAILKKLIEALRHELQEYGEMLALLDHQRDLITQRGADEILHSIAAINQQHTAIQAACQQRALAQQELAGRLQMTDTPAVELIPHLSAPYRPLLRALFEENRQLVEQVKHRAGQNQALMQRSTELMQRFLRTISPPEKPATLRDDPGISPDRKAVLTAVS